MYFQAFPVIPYDNVGKGEFKDVTNLLRRVAVRSKVKTSTVMFDTYDVKEGDTPESIADKLYDDPELHWIILLMNNITDRYHQWPMRMPQFQAFVTEKYSNPNGVHHYEVPQDSGDTSVKISIGVDNTDYPAASIVTNFEHEEREQDNMRRIKLLDVRFVPQFVDEFHKRIKESVI